jgi:hypothetical protein
MLVIMVFSGVILITLEFWGLFWSFRNYFGHFLVFKVILVIIVFSRSYWSFRGILIILGARGYFGHYDVSGVILVILEFSMLFWSLWCF